MILHQQENRESIVFALELQITFVEAGWQILGGKAIPNSTVYGVGNQDMDFGMRDIPSTFPSDSVQTLWNALDAAGFSMFGFQDPKLPDDMIQLVIHPRP